MHERTGLSDDETDRAAWTVSGDVRAGGARAFGVFLAVALNSGVPLWPWRVPGVTTLLDRVYELVAANRHRLPGDEPWCDAHPGACGPG